MDISQFDINKIFKGIWNFIWVAVKTPFLWWYNLDPNVKKAVTILLFFLAVIIILAALKNKDKWTEVYRN